MTLKSLVRPHIYWEKSQLICWFMLQEQIVNVFTHWAKPHIVFLFASLFPVETTAKHFWSWSQTFGLSTKPKYPPSQPPVPHLCTSTPLHVHTSSLWDTAWNKEPFVWSQYGVTLTRSSPETLHPWLQVTAPADWYPPGILSRYQGYNLNFGPWQYTQVLTCLYPITHS